MYAGLWIPLVFPLLLLSVLWLVLRLDARTALWAQSPAIRVLPYILLGVAAFLGGVFRQTRVLYIALMAAFFAVLLDVFFFRQPHPVKGQTVLLLAAFYLPWLSAALYRLGERGLFTAHGGVRFLLVFAAALVSLLLPNILELGRALAAGEHLLLRCPADWMRVPVLGLLSLAASVPFLIVRREHESPAMGPLLLCALLLFFSGLNFRSAFVAAAQARSVFLVFSSAGALCLAWVVIENAWRNATVDELTQLPGRHSMKHHFNRLGSRFSIAVLDIDFFKRVNDAHGHAVGDQVLRFVASCIRSQSAGQAYRCGGEEFVLVFATDDLDEVRDDLERLRRSIQDTEFRIRAKNRPRVKPADARPARAPAAAGSVPLTVSIGAAASAEGACDPAEVMQAADQALYRAKRGGRNRVAVHGRPAGARRA